MNRLRLLLSTAREWLPTVALFLAAAGLLLGLAFWALKPTPPKKLVIATAAPQSAYQVLGQRYRDALKPYGVQVELRNTAGSVENLALLQDEDSDVDVAFVQGGTWQAPVGEDEPETELRALGGLFPEPVWLFYREDSAVRLLGGCDRPQGDASQLQVMRGRKPVKLKLANPTEDGPNKITAHACGELPSLSALKNWKVNAGADGSGVQALALRLLAASGLERNEVQLSHLTNTPAVVELLEGRSDAMFFVSAPEAPLIQMLLQTPGIRLLNFQQAQAFARKLPFLTAVTLPRGVVDLSRDLPPEDVHLVAPTATLVARGTVHPALIQLLVQAAARIHGSPGWFARANEFPHADGGGDIPLADEAQRYYKTGKPWMQRYMPFWLSNLIDRMWVALLSIVAVLIPLSRLVPPLYVFSIRSRVFRWYARLRDIEAASEPVDFNGARLLAELDEVDARAGQIQVPLSYSDQLYALRQHIDTVRSRVEARIATQGATAAG